MIPLIRPNMPSTAMPKMRKGMEIIQNSGYKIRPSKARGQQSIKRIIQSKKLIIPLNYTSPLGKKSCLV
jgi:hypothetical protein